MPIIPQEIRVTTTGTGASPLVFNDLGRYSITHPTTALNILLDGGFSLTEVQNSVSFQTAVSEGWITITDRNNTAITTLDPVITVAGRTGLVTIAASDLGNGSVSNAEFQYLDGVTSSIQTQINGKAATAHTHAASDITSGTLAVARIPTAIPASNIADGSVSNTEFQYLDGVTSSIQTQFTGKSNTGHTHVAADVTDFTSAARTATVADAINDATTNIAPSQNAVFDALALKINTTAKGAASGVASLDSTTHITRSELPIVNYLISDGSVTSSSATPATKASGTTGTLAVGSYKLILNAAISSSNATSIGLVTLIQTAPGSVTHISLQGSSPVAGNTFNWVGVALLTVASASTYSFSIQYSRPTGGGTITFTNCRFILEPINGVTL